MGYFRVVGVIDLMDGRAVHARAGDRERYEPVQICGGASIPSGDALALAHAYIDDLAISELYVADLDAIVRDIPQSDLISRIASLGAPVWVDAGVASPDEASRTFALGASYVIVGLETLTSYAALRDTCAGIGGDRVVFSLDLRGGAPLAVPAGGTAADSPLTVAARAAAAGAGGLIVIDLARVGMACGFDMDLIEGIRRAVPDVALLAGGGVRGLDDVSRLANAGCDGALVGTALQGGPLR